MGSSKCSPVRVVSPCGADADREGSPLTDPTCSDIVNRSDEELVGRKERT